MVEETAQRPGVTSELVDVRNVPLTLDDAGRRRSGIPVSARRCGADALIVVSPEYSHGCSTAQHLLDTCLEEYIHKAVGVVGVSAGPWEEPASRTCRPSCASWAWSRSSGM